MKENEYINVKRSDLEMLSGFVCQHVSKFASGRQEGKTCEEVNRGALCNSCWERKMAINYLNDNQLEVEEQCSPKKD